MPIVFQPWVGGRAVPRVLGNLSQWIPPLGVTGGLGQRVRKGGESLKTTQQAGRKGRRLESALLASLRSLLLQVVGGVRAGSAEGPGAPASPAGRGRAQVPGGRGAGAEPAQVVWGCEGARNGAKTVFCFVLFSMGGGILLFDGGFGGMFAINVAGGGSKRVSAAQRFACDQLSCKCDRRF